MFPQLCKNFCVFFLIMHILFCCTNQKNVLQKEMKDWTFEVHLLTDKPTSWFPLIESLKMTCAWPYWWFLNFLSEGLDCFSWPNVLPRNSKITVPCPKSVELKEYSQWLSILNCSKSAIWAIWKSIISSHGEARNIKFWQQINFIQKVSLGTSPQELVTSLPHNYVT